MEDASDEAVGNETLRCLAAVQWWYYTHITAGARSAAAMKWPPDTPTSCAVYVYSHSLFYKHLTHRRTQWWPSCCWTPLVRRNPALEAHVIMRTCDNTVHGEIARCPHAVGHQDGT